MRILEGPFKKAVGSVIVLLACVALGGCATEMMSSIEKGDRDSVAKFIEGGGDVNKDQRSSAKMANWSPLHEAAWSGQTEIAILLLDNGAKINVRDPGNGWTPLSMAIYNHHTQTVIALLERGADINMKTSIGNISSFSEEETPLQVAQKLKYDDIVKIIQEAQAERKKSSTPSIPKETQGREFEEPAGVR